jgi:hypothetical protein
MKMTQFLGSEIFDFTTYDGDVDSLFASKMIEVLECILNGTTFKYQEDESNYLNYLTMVNMPFLRGTLDYGTSIRGAWFDEYGVKGINDKPYEIGNITVPRIDIKIFIKELIDWSKIPD